MVCNKCGANVPDVSKYCMFCGSRVGKLDYYNVNSNRQETSNNLRTYYDDFDIDNDGPKSKRTAGLLGVFLGAFGAHRFYLGYHLVGVIQIVVSLLTCFIGGAIWGFVEGLCILCDTFITVDAEGNDLV